MNRDQVLDKLARGRDKWFNKPCPHLPGWLGDMRSTVEFYDGEGEFVLVVRPHGQWAIHKDEWQAHRRQLGLTDPLVTGKPEEWPEERIDAIGQNGHHPEIYDEKPESAWDGLPLGNPWLASHGHRPGRSCSPTYGTWLSMKSRCSDSENRNYGGKGVSVCREWSESFEAFLSDMGERPEGCTLDRLDSQGDYEPGNCRWATAKEQAANRVTNVYIEIDGDIMLATEAANLFSIPLTTFLRRYSEGLRGSELVDGRNRNYLRTGERVASSKLTEEKVREIKARVRKGESQSSVAKAFCVKPPTISNIMTGTTWRDVE